MCRYRSHMHGSVYITQINGRTWLTYRFDSPDFQVQVDAFCASLTYGRLLVNTELLLRQQIIVECVLRCCCWYWKLGSWFSERFPGYLEDVWAFSWPRMQTFPLTWCRNATQSYEEALARPWEIGFSLNYRITTSYEKRKWNVERKLHVWSSSIQRN